MKQINCPPLAGLVLYFSAVKMPAFLFNPFKTVSVFLRLKIITIQSKGSETIKHKDYFMLPNNIFSLELKPRDLAVLACLIRHKDNENDSCFPSRSLIAKECRIDAKTVDAALKELEDRSIIIKKHRYRENGSHTSNMYFIADIFAMT